MTLILSIIMLLVILDITGVVVERSRAKIAAATMFADEMQHRAENALKLAAEKEDELAIKERELAEARETLAQDLSEAEKQALRNRIAVLVGETNDLKSGINRLKMIAAEFSGGEMIHDDPGTIERFTTPVLFDVIAMSKRGQVQIFGFDATTGSMNDLLDTRSTGKDQFVVSRLVNSARVTLVFPHVQKMCGLRFRDANENHGFFRVEIADSLEDLDSRTNSYELLVPDTPLDKEADHEENIVTFPNAVDLRVIRLTVDRTGDSDHVRLQSLRFWGFPNLETSLKLLPANDLTRHKEIEVK